MANKHDRGDDDGNVETPSELPEDVVDEAETLTRRARRAVDENETEAYLDARDELLTKYGFTARIRDEKRAVLVCYPEKWVEDGTVRTERIDDIDRGVERPLEGPGDGDNWEIVNEHNDQIAAAIEDEHGPVHGANAKELATFFSNHYAKPLADATEEELAEFLTEYYPRNVWPTDDEKAVVKKSVELTIEHARKRY